MQILIVCITASNWAKRQTKKHSTTKAWLVWKHHFCWQDILDMGPSNTIPINNLWSLDPLTTASEKDLSDGADQLNRLYWPSASPWLVLVFHRKHMNYVVIFWLCCNSSSMKYYHYYHYEWSPLQKQINLSRNYSPGKTVGSRCRVMLQCLCVSVQDLVRLLAGCSVGELGNKTLTDLDVKSMDCGSH